MFNVSYIIKGFIVGVGASIPLGPVAVTSIQKTLNKGRASGMAVGLGAAVVDTFYATLAILSLTLIQEIIANNRVAVLYLGGVVVMAIGVKTFLTNPVKEIRSSRVEKRLWEDFLSAVALTLTNPSTLFLLLGLFTFTGIEVTANSPLHAILLTLVGLFVGASLWWFTLSTSINLLRDKIRLRQLVAVNRVAGTILAVIGLSLFLKALWHTLLFYYY